MTTTFSEAGAASNMCEKLKRKQRSLMGAFVSTHGRSIDDVDRSILEARAALIEVTKVSLPNNIKFWIIYSKRP